jgi:hypothetical protein
MSTRVPRGQLESFGKRYCNVTSFPPFASNDTLLDMSSSVAATRNCVKNIFEIRFSLRRRSEQRLPLRRRWRSDTAVKESGPSAGRLLPRACLHPPTPAPEPEERFLPDAHLSLGRTQVERRFTAPLYKGNWITAKPRRCGSPRPATASPNVWPRTRLVAALRKITSASSPLGGEPARVSDRAYQLDGQLGVRRRAAASPRTTGRDPGRGVSLRVAAASARFSSTIWGRTLERAVARSGHIPRFATAAPASRKRACPRCPGACRARASFMSNSAPRGHPHDGHPHGPGLLRPRGGREWH